MTQLAYDRLGAGPVLLLLHGLGLDRRCWDPVVTALAERFDVIAVDLPGFGDSASLSAGVEATPAALAVAVDGLLVSLGITRPHIVGNSLGGWVALELAGVRPVASLALLSPAGLWRTHTPRYTRASLLASRWLARHAGGLLSGLARHRAARVVILGQTLGRPTRMTAAQARTTIQALGQCPGFEVALAATTHRRYQALSAVDVPVTVAFGSRDVVLLRRQSRHIDQLPLGTRVQELRGCGHVPMSDDPDAVVGLITAAAGAEAVQATQLIRRAAPE
jgi:pimeloyl-ACP methyl ester carboxylesterase